MALKSNSFWCYHSPVECFSLSRRHAAWARAPRVTPYCVCFPGAVFSECPFKEGYDLSIGTSERGSSVDQATLPSFKFVSCLLGPTQSSQGGLVQAAEPHCGLGLLPGRNAPRYKCKICLQAPSCALLLPFAPMYIPLHDRSWGKYPMTTPIPFLFLWSW